MAVQIQFRRDTGANWESANTVLAAGEMGINTTTNQFKIGDGSTAWNSLSYAPISGTVADIDDVTNVTITSATNGDLLKWNGSAWVNASGYALLASPALTGTPTAPTAASGTDDTQIATTAFVTGAVTDLVGGAPGALDTLNELAAAIGDDASYASGITTALGLKAPLASPTFTGTPTLPTGTIAVTQDAANNSTAVATTAYVDNQASAAASALTVDGLSDATITSAASGQFLKYNGSAWVNDAIDLATDTVGNYMVEVSAGTGITVSHTASEGSTATISAITDSDQFVLSAAVFS